MEYLFSLLYLLAKPSFTGPSQLKNEHYSWRTTLSLFSDVPECQLTHQRESASMHTHRRSGTTRCMLYSPVGIIFPH